MKKSLKLVCGFSSILESGGALNGGNCDFMRIDNFDGFMNDLNLSEEAEHLIVAQHWLKRKVASAEGWHTPNGEKRGKATAARLKAQGVLPGIPDWLFFNAGHLYGIELKRRRSGVLSKVQKNIITKLNATGGTMVMARGADEALDYLERWGLVTGTRWDIDVEGIRRFPGHKTISSGGIVA